MDGTRIAQSALPAARDVPAFGGSNHSGRACRDATGQGGGYRPGAFRPHRHGQPRHRPADAACGKRPHGRKYDLQGFHLGGHARQCVVHRRADGGIAAGNVRAGHRYGPRGIFLSVGTRMASDLIEVTRDGVIVTVMLNRPEKLNALTRAMWLDLGAAFDALSVDDSIRCVILRGAGEKAFSPGNDIAEFATERANKAQAIEYGRLMHRTLSSLAE